jgi:hypothetical protein
VNFDGHCPSGGFYVKFPADRHDFAENGVRMEFSHLNTKLSAGLSSPCASRLRAGLASLAIALPSTGHAGTPDGELYENLIGAVFSEFSEEIAAQSAATEVVFHRNSSGAGAFTWRKNAGRVWEFHFYDGVLKIKNVTSDVLSLIVCHELGHHLAGYPFKEDNNWSAAEGQADYFSTHACAPRIWRDEPELNALFASRIPVEFKTRCDESFLDQQRRDICYRTVAAMDAMRFYEGSQAKKLPALNQPDPTRVSVTNTRHPQPQCRIDTQLAGAFCSSEFDFSRVPGHLGAARNTAQAERDAAPSHCDGAQFAKYMRRPQCWFAPITQAQ